MGLLAQERGETRKVISRSPFLYLRFLLRKRALPHGTSTLLGFLMFPADLLFLDVHQTSVE